MTTKAWKGWSDGCRWVDDVHDPGNTPVLVMDTSDWPEGYPEIGSKWLGKITGATHKVCGPPIHNGHHWFVASKGQAMMVRIADLTPIPTKATGEVVGSIVVDANGKTFTGPVLPPGTYDIIERGDPA